MSESLETRLVGLLSLLAFRKGANHFCSSKTRRDRVEQISLTRGFGFGSKIAEVLEAAVEADEGLGSAMLDVKPRLKTAMLDVKPRLKTAKWDVKPEHETAMWDFTCQNLHAYFDFTWHKACLMSEKFPYY